MSSPDTQVEQWLVAQLKASAAVSALVAGRVYWDIIPQEAPLPAVRLSLLQGVDQNFYTGERALTRDVVQVVGITHGASLSDGIALRDAIDATLAASTLKTQGLSVRVSRVGRVRLVDIDAGEQFNLIGGKYRVVYYGEAS
jgi:hypothetical protein